MSISSDIPPAEHDSAIASQVNELLNTGLDSALKLSLLSEAWILAKHEDCGGTVTDFAVRLGYSDELVRQELDQLAKSGYFKRCCEMDRTIRYFLTEEAPRLQTVRRLLSSWRDLRFYLRANSLLTFRLAPGAQGQV